MQWGIQHRWGQYSWLIAAVISVTVPSFGENSFAGQITWVKDFKEAETQAKKKNRPIFIYWQEAGASPAAVSADVIDHSKNFICVNAPAPALNYNNGMVG